VEKILNLIGGQHVLPASGRFLDNVDPSTGEVYSLIPDSDQRDVADAVTAARAAFPVWSGMAAEKRAAVLNKMADLIDRDWKVLAAAESRDNGKTLKLASTLDIPRASANIRFFASGIQHFASEAHLTGSEAVNYTIRAPWGVAGCISPWNLPLYLFTWKIAPALAAGCTVVAKPSELTPMTAYLFSHYAEEAGMPAGALNIVHGSGSSAGQAIVEHPDVAGISFTGGTVTGRKIAATAAPMFKKLSLELGGKNPNIVFADCDFEKTVQQSVRAAFTNQGEICLCGSRIFVEAALYEKFVAAFVQETSRLRVGNPADDSTDLGPLVTAAHRQKVEGYIALALEEGGTIAFGGRRPQVDGLPNGFFLEPTVITGLSHHCRTNQEEIFGPVVTIMPFQTEAEALEYANSTTYGLAATVFTENLSRAHRMAAQIRSGIIWINCWLYRDLRTPFGGMKQSGVGREGGWEALRFFTEAKNVCIKLP